MTTWDQKTDINTCSECGWTDEKFCGKCCNFDTACVSMNGSARCLLTHSVVSFENDGRDCRFFNVPAAEVQRVRRGEWIEQPAFGIWFYDCSLCEDGYSMKERDEHQPNFCPNCGAVMKRKDGTNDGL